MDRVIVPVAVADIVSIYLFLILTANIHSFDEHLQCPLVENDQH